MKRDLLVPQYLVADKTKKALYHDISKDEIWEFMSLSTCKTLEDMIAWYCEREIDLETVRKRKSVHGQVSEGLVKKHKVMDLRWRCHLGWG